MVDGIDIGFARTQYAKVMCTMDCSVYVQNPDFGECISHESPGYSIVG